MASGKTHDFLALTTTLGASYYLSIAGITSDFYCILIFSIASLFGGLMFGPDLDIRSVQSKRWGPLKFIWLPYQSFGHRSKKTQSHDALFGPVVRILYFYLAIVFLSIFVAGLFSVFNLKLSLGFLFSIWNVILEIPLKYQVSFLAGLWYGNIVHYLADWFCAFTPKRKRV
jgi:uncharacterized metal-binding protein